MRTGARVVLISGNHDSARRLGFGAELIDAAGVHLRTDPAHGRPAGAAGRADGSGQVAVYPIPYLEPDAVRADLLDEATRTAGTRRSSTPRWPASAPTWPADRVRGRWCSRTRSWPAGWPSDSERDISVGGVSVVPATTFAGVDYTALGHLHGAQAVDRDGPLQRLPHRLLVLRGAPPQGRAARRPAVDGPGSELTVEALPTPVHRPIARVRSSLDDLLTAQRWSAYTDHYLQVTLTDAERPREAMARLRTRFPHTLVLAFEPEADRRRRAVLRHPAQGQSDLDVAADFIAHVRSAPGDDEAALLADAFDVGARRRGGASDAASLAHRDGVRSVRRPAARSTSTLSAPAGSSSSTVRPARAKRASSTPCASRCTASCREPAPAAAACAAITLAQMPSRRSCSRPRFAGGG